MNKLILISLLVGSTAMADSVATGEKVLFPSSAAGNFLFKPSDNGSDTKAFTPVVKPDVIEVKFNDRTNQDNYLHVDLGPFEYRGFYPGGYVEIDAEIDRPVLRIAASLSEPKRFWPLRHMLESEASMKAGRHLYRFYLDTVSAGRAKSDSDHIFLFLHDYTGNSRGQGALKIYRISVNPPVADWKQQKSDWYARQYDWRKFMDMGKYYRGKYDQLVPWSELADNPFCRRYSLNGDWQKQFFGDKTWKYDFLQNVAFATPGKALTGAKTVTVPEAAVEDQVGGHYWYKRDFQLKKTAGDRIYLRFDDLADSAEVYINGKWIGTQSSVRKRHEWIMTNGSRHVNTWNKSVKEVVKWQHFERCGIKCPIDPAALPDDDTMMLPIYTGQYEWPYAFDITDAAVDGDNTVAVRLYGCPIKGWWIFRHGEDRAAKNVFGLLGNVQILVDRQAAIAGIEREQVGQVTSAGIATHRINCKLDSRLASSVVRAVVAGPDFAVEMKRDKGELFSTQIKLPAAFVDYRLTVTAFDRDGRAVDRRDLIFNGTVTEIRDGRMFVNGDRYLIRGINATLGVEWDNDRKVTRREWLRQLRFLQQLGFNTLRLEAVDQQHLRDAQAVGMMVMPVYASASCNNTMTALGNLSNPDYEFNTDAHKEMALLLSSAPNVLLWNSGNETWHTGGYNDKPLLDNFMIKARESIKRFDPYRRGVVYANLDVYNTNWFCTAGQDVIGYNTYAENDLFRKMMKQIYQETKKPIVLTEWGFHDNEARAIKDRNSNMADWERRMAEKERIIAESPGSLGGFLYAYHGELKDDRGRAFLQKIMSSFLLRREANALIFENQDVCPLRKVSLMLVSDTNVEAVEYAAELAPGKKIRISLTDKLAKIPGLRVEMNFDTHRGLNHFYSRMVDLITTAK